MYKHLVWSSTKLEKRGGKFGGGGVFPDTEVEGG